MALRALKAAYDSDSDSEEPSPKRHKAQEQAATATAPAQRDAALLPALPDVITHVAGASHCMRHAFTYCVGPHNWLYKQGPASTTLFQGAC